MSSDPTPESAPLLPRLVAARLLAAVTEKHRALDAALSDRSLGFAALAPRDRALVRRMLGATLRRLGQIDAVLHPMLDLWPKGMPLQALRIGAAELLFLGTPPHAAVASAVDSMPKGAKSRKLVNAVLRRISREGAALIAGQDERTLNTPRWLMQRWEAAYGRETALAITTAHLGEAPLDITVKGADAAHWAAALEAEILPTGSLRRIKPGAVDTLPGFADGAWWVQDAAAALPARLFGDVSGMRVADLCAAPGGKTAQLAAAGAQVIAVDRSAPRLESLRANLKRLGLDAEIVCAEAEAWRPDVPLDGVLLDAPCTATGTIRRHPDLPYLKRPDDVAKLSMVQRRLMEHAIDIVKPGGLVIYAVCSMEAEEGAAHRIELNERAGLEWLPIRAGEAGIPAEMIDKSGALRALPCHWPALGGIDGFYAFRFRKKT